MAAPRITAQNLFLVPPPATSQAAPRKRFVAAQESRCRALTKLPNAVDHRGPQCSRRKKPDTNTPRARKSDRDLVADELCSQHKLMLDRFEVMIMQQLREEQMAIPGFASDPPVVAKASAGTAAAPRGCRNGDVMGVRNNMVFNHGMGFGNGMAFTGDMDLDHARGHRSSDASSMGDAGRITRSTSSSPSSVSRGLSRTHESRRGIPAFNPRPYSSGVIDQEIDRRPASITSQRRHIESNNSASSFRSRNDLRRSDFDAMNTTAGPGAPLNTADCPVYPPLPGDFDTPVAGLHGSFFTPSVSAPRSNQTRTPSTSVVTANCPVYPPLPGDFDTPVTGLNGSIFAPSVSAPHSNHILPMEDHRTRTPNGRETPQLDRGVDPAPSFQGAPTYTAPACQEAPTYTAPAFHEAPTYTAPAFQEAPISIVDHAPQRLGPGNKTACDHTSLVRQCTYLTEVHKPRLDRAIAETGDWRKKRAIEDLGAALDGLLSLDDAVAGSLISDCEALLHNHTPAGEGSRSTPDRYKLSMMRQLQQQVDILRHCVTEAVEDCEEEEWAQDTESEL